MRLTRRQVVAGAAAGAVSATGIYALVERLAGSPERPGGGPRPPEQHVLQGVRVVTDNDVEVLVPPLHHQVVTARLEVGESPAELRDAQAALEEVLGRLDEGFEPTPAGLGVTVAWGLPYFHRHVPELAEQHLPLDRRIAKPVLLDAIRFPSDPEETILEENELAVLLRSDSLDHIADGARELFDGDLGFLAPTSIRKGFAGGGFEGGQGLPKQMAQAAGIPGAELIPDGSELFLGFTSSQKAGIGPLRIVNFETLGLVDLSSSEYFRGGTNMHLSHLFEDLEAWYLDFDHDERVHTAFRPELRVPGGTKTVAQGPDDVASPDDVARGFQRERRIGHSAAIQTTSRLLEDVTGPVGVVGHQPDCSLFATAVTGHDPLALEQKLGQGAPIALAGEQAVDVDDLDARRLGLLIDLAYTFFVLARALLRLLEGAAERVYLGVDLAYLTANELLRCARRGHGHGKCQDRGREQRLPHDHFSS